VQASFEACIHGQPAALGRGLIQEVPHAIKFGALWSADLHWIALRSYERDFAQLAQLLWHQEQSKRLVEMANWKKKEGKSTGPVGHNPRANICYIDKPIR